MAGVRAVDSNISSFQIIKNGLLKENPVFVQVIGMCPTLAVTTSASNGLGMGLATAAVMVAASFTTAVLRKVTPNSVRIPIFIIIIAGYVTVVEFLLKAFMPALNASLGIFVPLIVANCLPLGRLESFASKFSVYKSTMDGIFMGLGFTLALTVIGTCRELLGNGSIFDVTILPDAFPKMLIMLMAPGAFFTLGTLMIILAYFKNKKAKGGAH